MNIKKGAVVLLSGLFLSSFINTAHQIFAVDYDSEISQQTEKLNKIKQLYSGQEEKVNTLLSEISTIENNIATTKRNLEDAQKRIEQVTVESMELSEVIEKRQQYVDEQSRMIQTVEGSNTFIDIIFSSDSVVDAISRLFAMSEVTNASHEILEQQQRDKLLLEEKRLELENLAINYAVEETALQSLKDEHLVKVSIARSELIDLALQKDQTAETIASLQQEKAEAEEKKRLAEEAARKQAEEIKRQQEIARAVALQKEQEKKAAQAAKATQNTANSSSNSNSQSSTGSNSNTSNSSTTAVVSSGKYVMPISNPLVTSPFGYRVLFGQREFHDGIDLVNGNPTAPIYAAASGTVIFRGVPTGAGNAIIIKTTEGLYNYYFHLSAMNVSVGQTVSAGQQIGNMGNTGRSTGAHLHFGVSTGLWSGYLNPSNYLGI